MLNGKNQQKPNDQKMTKKREKTLINSIKKKETNIRNEKQTRTANFKMPKNFTT